MLDAQAALAAAGMNLTGLSMGLSSLLWLILAVVFYALCDICLGELVTLMPAEHVFLRSLAAIGACFTAMGLAASAALWKFRPAKRELLDVIPYSFAYFSSILLLLVCFGLLGVVFGSRRRDIPLEASRQDDDEPSGVVRLQEGGNPARRGLKRWRVRRVCVRTHRDGGGGKAGG